jgi:hypothetical protein
MHYAVMMMTRMQVVRLNSQHSRHHSSHHSSLHLHAAGQLLVLLLQGKVCTKH